jgi:hypothetical protein
MAAIGLEKIGNASDQGPLFLQGLLFPPMWKTLVPRDRLVANSLPFSLLSCLLQTIVKSNFCRKGLQLHKLLSPLSVLFSFLNRQQLYK